MTTTLDTPLTARAAPRSGLSSTELIDLLLRDRRGFVHRLDQGRDLAATARALLITSLLSTAAFGASIGAYRGGIQIAYAALKLPLAVLLTAALVAPALTGLGLAARASDAPLAVGARLQRDLVIVLAALAIGGLVAAALAPVVVLAEIFGVGYHLLILTIVGACSVGGLIGLSLFFAGRAASQERGRGVASLGALALFAVVASQMCWCLRPFLVRPRTESVPFVRALEGSLFESVTQSADSARGIYTPDPEETPRRLEQDYP